MNSITLLSQRF